MLNYFNQVAIWEDKYTEKNVLKCTANETF